MIKVTLSLERQLPCNKGTMIKQSGKYESSGLQLTCKRLRRLGY